MGRVDVGRAAAACLALLLLLGPAHARAHVFPDVLRAFVLVEGDAVTALFAYGVGDREASERLSAAADVDRDGRIDSAVGRLAVMQQLLPRIFARLSIRVGDAEPTVERFVPDLSPTAGRRQWSAAVLVRWPLEPVQDGACVPLRLDGEGAEVAIEVGEGWALAGADSELRRWDVVVPPDVEWCLVPAE